MQQRDFLFSLFLLALGTGVVVESLRMPRMERFGYGPYAAPGLVPGIIGGVLALLAILLLIRTIRDRKMVSEPKPSTSREPVRALVVSLGLILIYAAVLVGSIPFGLATFIFLFAFIGYFEWQAEAPLKRRARHLGTAFAQAVIVAIAVTLLFERVFRVNLPG
ncbi:MAG: tripartite tricarboxylate transporter TctB family protein [Phycisphaeraceae bacterium]